MNPVKLGLNTYHEEIGMSKFRKVLWVLMFVAAGFTVSACCGEPNTQKTEACKDSDSSDACKECCGGSGYTYTGPGNCTCY